MSKITIVEGNNNDKDNVRAYMVKGEKGDKGDTGDPTKLSQLENDVGYITSEEANLQNYYNKSEIDATVETLNETIDEKADTTEIESEISVLSSSLTNESNLRNDGDNNLQKQLNNMNYKISSTNNGSPLFASSISGMTNTSKVYVNTTDGKWYYYNGTNWTVGGTFQARGLNDASVFPNKLTYAENDLLLSSQLDIIDYQLGPSYTNVLFGANSLGIVNMQRNEKIYINISETLQNISGLNNLKTYLRINELDSNNNILNRTNLIFDYTKINNSLDFISKTTNTAKVEFFVGVEYNSTTTVTATVHVENFVVTQNKKWIVDSNLIKTKYEEDIRGCETLPFYIDVKNRMNFMLGSFVYGVPYYNNNGRLISTGYQAIGDTVVNIDFSRFRLAILTYSDATFDPTTASDSGWKDTTQIIPSGTCFKLHISSALNNAEEYDLLDSYDNDVYKSLKMVDEYCYLSTNYLISIKNGDKKIPYILTPRKTRYIGHRGALYQAPENSKPSFIKAGENDDIWGIETDIYFSSDKKMFCIHDGNLSVTTTGTGHINNKTSSEVEEVTINYGAHLDIYPNEKVPYLYEFLDICFEYGKIPIIELKDTANANYTYLIVNEIKKYGFEENCIIISFSETLIRKVRESSNKIHCQLLIPGNTNITQNLQTYIEKINSIGNCGLSSDYQNTYSKEDVAEIHSVYGSFGIWTLEGKNTQYNNKILDTVTSNF